MTILGNLGSPPVVQHFGKRPIQLSARRLPAPTDNQPLNQTSALFRSAGRARHAGYGAAVTADNVAPAASNTENTNGRMLVHLCTPAEWEQAQRIGERVAPSLETEGFLHLSAPHQVHLPANRLFAGRDDMLLLWIDVTRLSAPLRWEPGVADDPGSMRFPHLYGPLPVTAVVRTSYYGPDEKGTFPALTADPDQWPASRSA